MKYLKLQGGGTPAEATVEDDTLSANQLSKTLHLVSYGEVGGLLDGGRSVIINDTPVQTDSSGYNFENISIDQRVGIPTQTHIAGFDSTTTIVNINQVVRQSTPVEHVLSDDKDACKITIGGGALYRQDSSGDVRAATVQFHIETYVASAGSWNIVHDITFQEKSSGEWSKQYRIPRDFRHTGTEDWRVRVVRITDDDNTAYSSNPTFLNEIYFKSAVEIEEARLSYNNHALVGLTIPAKSVSKSIGKVEFDIAGIKVQVPTNWNGTAYSGAWNGTWKWEVNDDPIWITRYLLTDDTVGLGIDATELEDSSFYNASAYCSQLIDGERRYSFNGVINKQDDPVKVINRILSHTACHIVPIGGLLTIIQDRPDNIVSIFSEANVIDGIFNYTSTDISQRLTSVNVRFKDKDNHHRVAIVNATASQSQIDKYGWNERTLDGFGITNEAEAKRYALYMLETSLREYDSVSFAVSFENAHVVPGDLIKIIDSNYLGETCHGRIIASNTFQITLDRAIELDAGSKVYVLDGDGDVVERDLVQTGSQTTLTMSPPLSEAPAVESPFFIENGGISGRVFRIYNVSEQDKHIFQISGQFSDPTKHPYIESGIVLDPPVYVDLGNFEIDAPTNIVFEEILSVGADGMPLRELNIRWSYNIEDNIDHWDFDYTLNGVQTHRFPDLSRNEIVIPMPKNGLIDCRVRNVNYRGIESPYAYGQYTISDGETEISTHLSAITDIRRKGTTHGVGDFDKFFTRNCSIEWTDENDFTPNGYLVIVKDGSTEVGRYNTRTPSFLYTYEMNESDNDGSPIRAITFDISAVDSKHAITAPASATITNDAPAVPSLTVSGGLRTVIGEITYDPVDIDIEKNIIYANETQGFTPADTDIVAEGDIRLFEFSPTAGTWYVRGKVIDAFGVPANDGTLSSEYTVSVSAITAEDVPDYRYEGLNFKPNDPATNQISWSAGTGIDRGDGSTWSVNSGSATWSSGTLILYNIPTSNTILTTSDYAVAVAGNILCTYRGGTDLAYGKDGGAYLDGGLVLAQTIGATQLVANQAVITGTAQIANSIIGTSHIDDASISQAKIIDGTISSAKITNIIQSDNYSDTTKQGWRLQKNGSIQGNSINIYDSSGNLVLGSGGEIDWERVVEKDFGIYSGGTDAHYDFNGTFSGPWQTGQIPTGWNTWWHGHLNTRGSGSGALSGDQSYIRFDVDGTENRGISKDILFSHGSTTAGWLPEGSVIEGSVRWMFGSNNGTSPMLLIRLYTNSTYTTYVDTHVVPQWLGNQWISTPWTASANGQPIHRLKIHVMAAWNGTTQGNGGTSGWLNGYLQVDSIKWSIKSPEMYGVDFGLTDAAKNIPVPFWQSGDHSRYGFNGTFSGEWSSGQVPDTYIDWAAGWDNTRGTDGLSGDGSTLKYYTDGTNNRGLRYRVEFNSGQGGTNAFLDPWSSIEGSVRWYFNTSGGGGPLLLIRLFTNLTYTSWVDTAVYPRWVGSTWQTTPFCATCANNVTAMDIYVMASWSNATNPYSGASGYANGHVFFDSIKWSIKAPAMFGADFNDPDTIRNKITSGNIGTYMSSAAIGAAYIQDAAITNAKIQNNAITNAKIANATILGAKIANGVIGSAHIGNAQITNAKIGNLAVNTLKVADGSITQSHVLWWGDHSWASTTRTMWNQFVVSGASYANYPLLHIYGGHMMSDAHGNDGGVSNLRVLVYYNEGGWVQKKSLDLYGSGKYNDGSNRYGSIGTPIGLPYLTANKSVLVRLDVYCSSGNTAYWNSVGAVVQYFYK